jgi:hypothetical protein
MTWLSRRSLARWQQGTAHRRGQRTEPTPSWDHFAHDADIGVRGIGPTKAEAFRQAAFALTSVVTDPTGVLNVASRSTALDLRARILEQARIRKDAMCPVEK